ncbi:MAG: hypothetical protein OER88_09725, partial [Planctomycetota bacterium]|nr:hypothetical protein [Planctomycetota bacterium]
MRRLIVLFLLTAVAGGDLDDVVRAEQHLEAAHHRLIEIAQALLRRDPRTGVMFSSEFLFDAFA